MADNFINGFVAEYPYTNFHELNADYILRRLREVEDKVLSLTNLVHDEVAAQIQPYVDQVDAINSRMTELDSRVTNTLSLFEQSMTSQFAAQNNQINQRFNQILNDVNRQIEQLEADYDLLFEQFKTEIVQSNSEFQRNILGSINTINARIDSVFDYIQVELARFLDELPESFYVHSPITGTIVTVQEAVNQLYDNCVRYRGITCDQYDALGLTAEDYDDLEITAIEFDLYGLDVLPVVDTLHNMFSPFTGEWVPLQTVIEELAALHRAYSLTAEELDALDLNVDELEAYDYTAFMYDWYNKNIFE